MFWSRVEHEVEARRKAAEAAAAKQAAAGGGGGGMGAGAGEGDLLFPQLPPNLPPELEQAFRLNLLHRQREELVRRGGRAGGLGGRAWRGAGCGAQAGASALRALAGGGQWAAAAGIAAGGSSWPNSAPGCSWLRAAAYRDAACPTPTPPPSLFRPFNPHPPAGAARCCAAQERGRGPAGRWRRRRLLVAGGPRHAQHGAGPRGCRDTGTHPVRILPVCGCVECVCYVS